MSKTLSELLMREKRMKVLNTLLENKDRTFTISELSKKSGVGYKTTHKLVGKLEKFGIIDTEEKGASRIVSLNQRSPYMEVLVNLAEIDSRPLVEVAERFAEEIKDRNQEIETLALFGSVIKGLPTEKSDIDILVLTDSVNTEDIEEEVWAVRDRYEREEKVEISPLVMEKRQFRLNAENGEPLESRIQEQGEVLVGEALDEIQSQEEHRDLS